MKFYLSNIFKDLSLLTGIQNIEQTAYTEFIHLIPPTDGATQGIATAFETNVSIALSVKERRIEKHQRWLSHRKKTEDQI